MAPAEVYNSPIPLPKTLWHAFDAAVASRPQAPAYTVLYQPADHLSYLLPHGRSAPPRAGHLSWTFAELKHATVRVAASMLERGVQRGSTLVTFLPNGMERELLTWVSAALQLMLMPLDPALFDPGRKDELEHYITSVTPHVVVVNDDRAAAEWDKWSTRSEALKLSLGPSSQPQWITFKDLSSSSSSSTQTAFATQEALVAQQDLAVEDSNERVAALLYTSGTSSGKPKGCAISSRQFLTIAQLSPVGHVPRKSVPVYSANFRSMSNWFTFGNILIHVRIVLPWPTFDTARLLDAIEECQIDSVQLMPFMLYEILRDAKYVRGERDLSCMKVVTLGGDVITTDVVERAQKIFGNAAVAGGHAMSEAIGCMNTALNLPNGRQPSFGDISCGGAANQAGSIRICDDEGKVVERGQLGELHLGGSVVMRRYWRDVQPEVFYEDEKANWLLTGDRAVMDEEGRVFVVGRSKDIIKRKGMTFSPAVLSSTLNSRPGIVASVFGIPHEFNGEAIVAVVEDDNPPNSRDRIRAIVTESLGPDYALDELYTLADLGMDKFPIGPTRKVLNLTLKQAVLKLKEGRGSAANSNGGV